MSMQPPSHATKSPAPRTRVMGDNISHDFADRADDDVGPITLDVVRRIRYDFVPPVRGPSSQVAHELLVRSVDASALLRRDLHQLQFFSACPAPCTEHDERTIAKR